MQQFRDTSGLDEQNFKVIVPLVFSSLAPDRPWLLTHDSVSHRNLSAVPVALIVGPFPSTISAKEFVAL